MKTKAVLWGVFMALAGVAQADVTWNADPVDSNLANVANWSGNPAGQTAKFQGTNSPSAVLSSEFSPNNLFVAHDGNTTGTLELRDGAKLTISNLFYVGANGTGTVNVTGGSLSAKQVWTGDQAAGNAELNLSGGSMSFSELLTLGTRGTAVLNVSGGTLNAQTIAVAGSYANSSRGTVNQTNGTVTVTDTLRFGTSGSKGVGTYNLSGGTLTAPTVKYGNTNTTASFRISGTGEAVISGAVAVPTTLSGGTLTAGSITNTLTQTGGLLTPGGVGAFGTTTITGKYLAELTNVARSKPTSQVKNYVYGFPGSNAVDGIIDPSSNNFTHTDPTAGKTQWWQVMFSENDMPIESVKLYNRDLNGSTARRLTDNGCGFHFELYSGTLENPGEMIGKSETYTAETWSQGKELPLDFAENGNILRVVRDFADGYDPAEAELVLSLAEVEIYAGAGIQMDIAADGLSDKILIGDGGSMDITNTYLDIMIDDISAVAPGTEWTLFETSGNGTLTGDFLSVTLNDAALGNGWEFADGILSFNGTNDAVPEPGTMVLLALGLGGLFLVRRKR